MVFEERICSCGNKVKLNKNTSQQTSDGYWQNCEKCDSTLLFPKLKPRTSQENLAKERKIQNERVKKEYKLKK